MGFYQNADVALFSFMSFSVTSDYPKFPLLIFYFSATVEDDNSFAMMQIECEVMSTRLVHVDKASVPQQFHENATSHGDSGDSWRRYEDPNDRR